MGQKRKFKRYAKVDLDNPDQAEIERMISDYQQKQRKEVPLIIDDKLTIMVTPDKCNERYRNRYINAMLKGIK